jgi:hypothetical protein
VLQVALLPYCIVTVRSHRVGRPRRDLSIKISINPLAAKIVGRHHDASCPGRMIRHGLGGQQHRQHAWHQWLRISKTGWNRRGPQLPLYQCRSLRLPAAHCRETDDLVSVQHSPFIILYPPVGRLSPVVPISPIVLSSTNPLHGSWGLLVPTSTSSLFILIPSIHPYTTSTPSL